MSYIDTNQPWIYMCSPSRSPLPPPSPPDSSGSSQGTRPKHLSHASSLGWWSVSPKIIYTFWCCALKTSHPRNMFICFNWRLITLKYCSRFCHTLTWISHGCTCVPHPEPPPPNSLSIPSLRVIPVHQPEHLVSCIKPGLAIYFRYDNVHVSMLVSNHPTLAFSHRVQKTVLYIYVSFAVVYRIIITIFLNSIYMC